MPPTITKHQYIYMENVVLDNVSIPVIKVLPRFYQDVIIAFDRSQTSPISGWEYFKIQNTCLYFEECINKYIMYIMNLIENNGNVMNDEMLYECKLM